VVLCDLGNSRTLRLLTRIEFTHHTCTFESLSHTSRTQANRQPNCIDRAMRCYGPMLSAGAKHDRPSTREHPSAMSFYSNPKYPAGGIAWPPTTPNPRVGKNLGSNANCKDVLSRPLSMPRPTLNRKDSPIRVNPIVWPLLPVDPKS